MERYTDVGIDTTRILRTNLGADEGLDDWFVGRNPGESDQKGDEIVEVVMRAAGTYEVGYK